MIKLFTSQNLSAFSSDAIYKLCLSLDRYGLTDDMVSSFESYDELFDAAQTALAAGDYVIIGAENADYMTVKRILASRLMLEQVSAPQIAEAIAMKKNSSGNISDMEAQCTVPEKSRIHLSGDGLYSGFTAEYANGLCTLVPLDFERLDDIIESYIKTCLELPSRKETSETLPEVENKFIGPVSKMVSALSDSDKTVAIALGEVTTNIYDLYSEIDRLSEVVRFVTIVDSIEEPELPEESIPEAESDEITFDELDSDDAEDFEALLSEMTGEEESAYDDEEELPEEIEEPEAPKKEPQTEALEQLKEETPSAKTARYAREAMENADASLGAAISELYEVKTEDGSSKYFAYVAVSDNKTTKTKVISTANREETALLLDHCVTVLSQLVCKKLEDAQPFSKKTTAQEPKNLFSFSKRMIAFAAAVLVVAVSVPLFLVHMLYGSGAEINNTTLPDIVTGEVNQVALPVSQTSPFSVAPTTTAPSTTNSFGLPGAYTTVPENGYTPAEPPATEISAVSTPSLISSTSGTFTFYVFGYGHGAGMSQTGANYLASQGWNYAQILANYYYGTTLVSGDTYPTTIKYNDQEYKTRDFLAGVLEAEMGGSYLPEALKAQAVAAYTFAKYYAFNLDTDKMAYKPTDSQSCYNAVDAIMNSGVYIAYNGSPALTPFFATSAGKTTSYYNVWGQYELPYLQGGRPSYGDYNAQNFKQVKTYSSADMKAMIQSRDPSITLSGDPATWITIVSHDDAVSNDIGYVSSINVGGKIMSGNDFRIKIMGGDLNSHCFMLVYTPDR